jgi:hypothetical protein
MGSRYDDGAGDGDGIRDPRAAGLAEWRMERIEQLVKPTEAQRSTLDGSRNASTKAAGLISAACPNDFPASAPGRLEAVLFEAIPLDVRASGNSKKSGSQHLTSRDMG